MEAVVAKIMNVGLISLLMMLLALSFAVAGEIHPGLKNAIDNGDYKMAKNLVAKVGVKDIYCPASLSVKEAENIYSSILQKNPLAIVNGDGENVFYEPEFNVKYAEAKCNGKLAIDNEICTQWRKRSYDTSYELFSKWFEEEKGLCLNAETMEQCEWFAWESKLDKRMEIFRQVEKKKLISYDRMIERDTMVHKPIPKGECLNNLKEYEKSQKIIIGAKKNATGWYSFPFDACYFDRTMKNIDVCIDKLRKAVKKAEDECKRGLATRDEKKKIKRKEKIFPLKNVMEDTKAEMLKKQWYQMDEKWVEDFLFLAKHVGKEDEKEIIDEIKKEYSLQGDLGISYLVRSCKVYPSIDKKIKKILGVELFSCSHIIAKYQPLGAQCDAPNASWMLKSGYTLNSKDSSDAIIVCDKKTGRYRLPDKYESISREICENPESSWAKTYGSGSKATTLVCDKKLGRFRESVYPEFVAGLCTKESEKKEYVWFTCLNEKWEDTKEVNTKNLQFDVNVLVKGEVNPDYMYFKDFRDGQIYRAVKIGDQIWMAENLNYVDSLLKRNWCYYPNDCKTFGRHYSWHDAVADDKKKNPVRGICPEGWHIPDTTEWKTFFAAVNSSVYSIQAKALGKWTNSTDATGFSVIPVGFQFYSNRLEEQGSETHFWSANECDHNIAYGKALSWVLKTDHASFGCEDEMDAGNSVRCVKDSE